MSLRGTSSTSVPSIAAERLDLSGGYVRLASYNTVARLTLIYKYT